LFESSNVSENVLQLFLGINSQMEEAIAAVENRVAPEELKTFKKAVGYVMYEVFEKVIEPICERHPALRPPGLDD
jgi:hypothetical protein